MCVNVTIATHEPFTKIFEVFKMSQMTRSKCEDYLLTKDFSLAEILGFKDWHFWGQVF
jgi:hypothetical protein